MSSVEIEDDGFVTDSGSEVSQDEKQLMKLEELEDDDDVIEPFDPNSESILDRLYALRDIVPPLTRARISRHTSQAVGYSKTAGRWGFNAVWVVTTSALLVVLPAMLALEGEAVIAQQEREYQQQQAGAAQVRSPSSSV